MTRRLKQQIWWATRFFRYQRKQSGSTKVGEGWSLLAFGQLLGAGNGSNENDFVPGGHRIRPTIKWCLSGVSTSNRRYSNQQESNRAYQPRPRPISRILSASKESEATTSWYLDVSWAQRLFQATLLQAKVAVSAVAFNPNSYLFFCPGPVETF